MSKISNKTAYPAIAPVLEDYFVLTDSDTELATKTCTLSALQDLFEGGTKVAKVAIPSGSLLTLATTAVDLVAAPGAGKVIDVISIMFYLNAGLTAYDYGTGALPIKLGSEQVASVSNSSTTINSATDAVFKAETPNSVTEVVAQNAALVLEAQSNPTQGNGVLYANVFYRVLTVGTSF
tara:strand:- start:599 stop:1135 length:537 start_codon:yes stop_codon:yes gene_type:complete